MVEVLLAANESLVAYRRRHRSDVELEAAISLLIHDDTNPRSLVSAIDRLERHAIEGDWPIERALAERARAALELPLHELLPAARSRDRRGRHTRDRALVLGAGVARRAAADRGRDVVTRGRRAPLRGRAPDGVSVRRGDDRRLHRGVPRAAADRLAAGGRVGRAARAGAVRARLVPRCVRQSRARVRRARVARRADDHGAQRRRRHRPDAARGRDGRGRTWSRSSTLHAGPGR